MTPLCRELGPLAAALLDHVARHVRTYSDAGFAHFLGVEKSTVSRWRNAGENMPVEAVACLSRFTGRPDVVWGFFAAADDCSVSTAPDPLAPEQDILPAIAEAGSLIAFLGHALADGRVTKDEATRGLPMIREYQRRLDALEADLAKVAGA